MRCIMLSRATLVGTLTTHSRASYLPRCARPCTVIAKCCSCRWWVGVRYDSFFLKSFITSSSIPQEWLFSSPICEFMLSCRMNWNHTNICYKYKTSLYNKTKLTTVTFLYQSKFNISLYKLFQLMAW